MTDLRNTEWKEIDSDSERTVNADGRQLEIQRVWLRQFRGSGEILLVIKDIDSDKFLVKYYENRMIDSGIKVLKNLLKNVRDVDIEWTGGFRISVSGLASSTFDIRDAHTVGEYDSLDESVHVARSQMDL